MKNITLEKALTFVRASIDELAQPSDMLVDEILDDRNLHLTVRHLLPEAYNEIAMSAPATMLEGIDCSEDCEVSVDNDGVMTIHPNSLDDFLRVASFRASHSDVVVTESVDEASPVGRMQLNKYVRGTHDAPVLVRIHGKGDTPEFKYYSCIKKLAIDVIGPGIGGTVVPLGPGVSSWDGIAEFTYVRRAYELTSDTDYIECPDQLVNAVLDYLVGLVLQTYNEADKAALFIKRATDMLNIQ